MEMHMDQQPLQTPQPKPEDLTDEEWDSLWEAPLFSLPSASILDKPAPKE